jgi:predicted amidohydrolase
MPADVLRVATCQFAVSGSIKRNARQICTLLGRAAKAGADVAHFPECALSGYADADIESTDWLDWRLLRRQTQDIMALAKELKLWVVLGSTHQLTPPNKPHNSLYLISTDGMIVDRYDKRFCLESELLHYTPGNRFVYFNLNGIECSLLICFDVRFPELYRPLYKQGVQCLFQSFYNARQKGPSVHTQIMRQTMQCRAATNHLWVSMCNSSGYYSPYPSCFIQPDGKIIGQLRQNHAGMMVNTVDLRKKFYDPMAPFRDAVIGGKLTSGPGTVRDVRSRNTSIL